MKYRAWMFIVISPKQLGKSNYSDVFTSYVYCDSGTNATKSRSKSLRNITYLQPADVLVKFTPQYLNGNKGVVLI